MRVRVYVHNNYMYETLARVDDEYCYSSYHVYSKLFQAQGRSA